VPCANHVGVVREDMGVMGWWPYDWDLIDGCEGLGELQPRSVSIEIDQWGASLEFWNFFFFFCSVDAT
jgi:hypothetical protein